MCVFLRLFSFIVLATVISAPALAARALSVPCPDPNEKVDSSEAITNALLSISPGGTVRLEKCTYYLSAPVVIEGTFDGTLKGAGIGKTVLTTLPDVDGIEDVLMLNWISDLDTGTPGPTLAPTLFHFSLFGATPSRVAISDLTIEVMDEHPAFGSVRADLGFDGALLAIITVEGVKVSTDFDRLELRGKLGDFAAFGGNVLYGIEMWGELSYWPDPGTKRPIVGHHVLRRSVIEDCVTGYDAEGMVDSQLFVRDNRFVNASYIGVFVAAMESSTVHVAHNEIELAESPWFGIQTELVKGALINANHVAGSGMGGIYMGSGSEYRVLNNDFSDLIASWVPIVLGETTSDSLVVGADPASVFDLGTNNRIIPGKSKH